MSTVVETPLLTAEENVVSDVVFHVYSPRERWAKIIKQVAEYLEAGVRAVCVADQAADTVHIYQEEEIRIVRRKRN